MSTETKPNFYDDILSLMLDHCPKTADKYRTSVDTDNVDDSSFMNQTNTFLRRELCGYEQDTREMRLDLEDNAPFARWRNGVEEVLNQGVLA